MLTWVKRCNKTNTPTKTQWQEQTNKTLNRSLQAVSNRENTHPQTHKQIIEPKKQNTLEQQGLQAV